MKKFIVYLLCLLLLTGCSRFSATQPADSLAADAAAETPNNDADALTTSLDSDNVPAVQPAVAAFSRNRSVDSQNPDSPDTYIETTLSDGTPLTIANTYLFDEELITAAAEKALEVHPDGAKYSALLCDGDQHNQWTDLVFSSFCLEGRYPRESENYLTLLATIPVRPYSQISRRCRTSAETPDIDSDLAENIALYYQSRLASYNNDYSSIISPFAVSKRVERENRLWLDTLAEREKTIGAEFVNIETELNICSVTAADDYLIIGVSEWLSVQYQYPSKSTANEMGWGTDHVLVLQAAAEEYTVVNDFYVDLGYLDTSDGINDFLPEETDYLVWLFNYQPDSDSWAVLGYSWLE